MGLSGLNSAALESARRPPHANFAVSGGPSMQR